MDVAHALRAAAGALVRTSCRSWRRTMRSSGNFPYSGVQVQRSINLLRKIIFLSVTGTPVFRNFLYVFLRA